MESTAFRSKGEQMKKVILALLAVTIFAANTKSAITIPEATMKASFGPNHTFMLKAHGSNPIFTRVGYTFRAETYGYLLSDKYYYNVPVYVDFDSNNKMYRLYSTNEGVSVQVTILTDPRKSSYVLPRT